MKIVLYQASMQLMISLNGGKISAPELLTKIDNFSGSNAPVLEAIECR